MKAGRIAITCDAWTSIAMVSYVTVTMHFINDDWQLVSLVLQTRIKSLTSESESNRIVRCQEIPTPSHGVWSVTHVSPPPCIPAHFIPLWTQKAGSCCLLLCLVITVACSWGEADGREGTANYKTDKKLGKCLMLKENFGRFKHAASLLKLPLTCQYLRRKHIWSNHDRARWTEI